MSSASGFTPQRRSVGISVLVVAAAVMAYQASTSSWFLGAFLDGTTWSWVAMDPQALSTAGILKAPGGTLPALYTVFGIPAPVAWIGLAALLGVAASVSRLGILALVGVGAAWMARTAAVSVHGLLLETPDLQGRFAVDGSGYAQFLDWTWVLIALLVLSAAQITYAGHVRRRRAEEAGEHVESNLLDLFHTMQTTAVSRMSGANDRASHPKEHASSSS